MDRARCPEWVITFPLLLVLICCLGRPASAAVIFVNKNAVGVAQDGKAWSTAFVTIQAGANAAASGDEVWVAEGTYLETIGIPAGVTLYGGFAGTEVDGVARDVKANPTIVDGGGGSTDVITSRYMNAVIDGFSIRHGRNGINVFSGTLAVRNDILSGNSELGLNTWGDALSLSMSGDTVSGNDGGGVWLASEAALLSGCHIRANLGPGVQVVGGTATITDTTIAENAGDGVISSGVLAVLTNDTISANGGQGLYVDAGGASIGNSILCFNSGFGIKAYAGGIPIVPLSSHNDVFANTAGRYSGFTPSADQGDISADPLLSSIYHDIHLQPGSPCIDAGDDTQLTGTTDVYGKPRRIGAHVDIGSDESDGNTWVVPVHTRYVTPSGNDAADGLTWQTATKTVGAALLSAEGGDTVWVARGTYVEHLSVPAGIALYGGFGGSETDLSERDMKANPTILDGGGGNASTVTSGFVSVTVDGFTIRKGKNGVYFTCGSARLENNSITANLGIGVGAAACNLTVVNNTISGNRSHGVGASSGTLALSNNTISGNGGNGVAAQCSATLTNNTISANSGHGVSTSGSAALVNDTITANGGHGVYLSSGTISIASCIVGFNGGNGVNVFTSDPTLVSQFSHNDVFGNTGAAYSGFTPAAKQGNLCLDPLLSSRYHDIHIQPSSPCVDAGDDSQNVGTNDAFGKKRVVGAHVDIGSDESDGTTWTTPVHTLHVTPLGSDVSDGLSWATAKRTLAAALGFAQGGDEVWVANGGYSESVNVPAGVALRGGFAGTENDPGERDHTGVSWIWVYSGGNTNAVTCAFMDVVVDGFTIQGGRTGMYITSGTATLSNNTIFGSQVVGVYSYAKSTLTNNVIVGGGKQGVYSSGTATLDGNSISGNTDQGVYIDGTAILANNTITGNGSTGVYLNGSATLTNNTIAGNKGAGLVVSWGTASISNSIVAFNSGYGVTKGGGGIAVFSHNDVFGNARGQLSGYSEPANLGNISADPLFASTANKNYHLRKGSACIDAGTDSVVTAGETDFDGNPRIYGAHVDIGCIEYIKLSRSPIQDIVEMLKVAGGNEGVAVGFPADSLGIAHAVRSARKVAGLDANP